MTNDDDARTSATRRDREQLRAEQAGDAAPPAGRRKSGWLRETAIVVVSALVLSVLIKTFLVQAFFIPSGSMEDTFAVGDRVLVSKLAPGPLDVSRGDVVVFVDPGGWLEPQADTRNQLQRGVEEVLTFVGLLPQNAGEHLIKRIIGLGGDTVECCDADGRITVNGVGIDEPYLKPGVSPSDTEFSVTVPENHLWLMGDNRSNSQDSRAHQGDPGGGAVPMRNVVGTAVLILWPFDSWTVLRNPGDTFAEVPEP
ncbi:signal peptidase I [Oceanitalea stevensii]|uniref:Signal peptidase I n=1 Tax=Oceanitalea stevensii TaxID=2763072 RepID=A0ABR8YXH2_9MICO|nr:signal peptidase I [Oceanitalea stevensii]MBD8060768.1 signal peptidase I [Oceanitalea stevensii]